MLLSNAAAAAASDDDDDAGTLFVVVVSSFHINSAVTQKVKSFIEMNFGDEKGDPSKMH